jgi:NADP-dependent 3-hydroxy acid dehydrogenase YdfG
MRGKTVVVVGATGAVGEGVVEALIQAGASVVATSRSREKLETLKAQIGTTSVLRTVVGGFGSEQEATDLVCAIGNCVAQIDGAIASIGSWWQGPPLTGTALADFEKVMFERLTAHFLAAKSLVPLILKRPGGFYFLIGGASAEFPIAGSGPVSISGAAQVMLTKVLRTEAKDQPIRIQELMIWTTIATRMHGGKADPAWITPGDIARHIAALIDDPASGKDAVVHLRKRTGVGVTAG